MARSGWLFALSASAILLPLAATARGATDNITAARARTNYVEFCGGCHGIQGVSAPAPVPQLRDRVGYFMCRPEGRDYLIQLPNVAHAPIADPAELAELMNFVVFMIGGASTPASQSPFTADEVARLRASPLAPGASLKALRQRLVADMARYCGVPAALMDARVAD